MPDTLQGYLGIVLDGLSSGYCLYAYQICLAQAVPEVSELCLH